MNRIGIGWDQAVNWCREICVACTALASNIAISSSEGTICEALQDISGLCCKNNSMTD